MTDELLLRRIAGAAVVRRLQLARAWMAVGSLSTVQIMRRYGVSRATAKRDRAAMRLVLGEARTTDTTKCAA